MNEEDGLAVGPHHLLDKAIQDHEFGVLDVVALDHLLGEAGQDLYRDQILHATHGTEILDLLLGEDQDPHTDERGLTIRGKGQIHQIGGGDLGHLRGDLGHPKEELGPDLQEGIEVYRAAEGLGTAVLHHHLIERRHDFQADKNAQGPQGQINPIYDRKVHGHQQNFSVLSKFVLPLQQGLAMYRLL